MARNAIKAKLNYEVSIIHYERVERTERTTERTTLVLSSGQLPQRESLPNLVIVRQAFARADHTIRG